MIVTGSCIRKSLFFASEGLPKDIEFLPAMDARPGSLPLISTEATDRKQDVLTADGR
jgi:hypothetical protein